ncbi:MAG: 3-hydroxyacyl-CoA dehydrogenase NAD-binding domain-containing protein, partial [Spirochaetota bacterium]|nr:3-hydroxyacyl-CoA dehydrogenase NAD-binding domain-containing protein [Spirochaetota bacterium]
TTQHDGKLRDVDLLIEAVVEDVDTKIKVFTDIQSNLSESTIIASNTTSISINELSKHIKNKENFLGLHFFNPVDKMLLVEIIRSKYTSDKTILTAVNYARNIGKTPIVINDGVGFVTSRVLFPYLNEAVFLIEEGKDIELIDRVITSFGMPMGPITLLDVVGIDTAHSAGKILNTAFPDRFMQSPILKLLIDNNRLGQKSGMGFYLYSKKNKKGKRDENLSKLLKDIIVENKPSSENELTNRMILTMLLEAIRVLEDGVSTSVIDIDMAMILGIGFPTFRGGLLKYADSLGIKEILKLCDKFSLLGKRYEPPQLLINMAKQGKTFY